MRAGRTGGRHGARPPAAGDRDAPSATATWTYAWNRRGLIESEQVTIDGLTFVINPTYNSLGHLSSLRYPKAGDNANGRSVAYTPDVWGRPTPAVPGAASSMSTIP